MESREPDDIWLIKFYAPWCQFCKHLDPVWHQIGSELRSHGSLVQVGKSDATVNRGLAKEFRVANYPAIFMLKRGVKYTYAGPRTKDDIMEFADRIGGPLVRSLGSLQLFQHAMNRHEVLLVYVGATSPLKGNYTLAAEELVSHIHFYCTSRDVLPKDVSLPYLPAVVIFKDGTYFVYNEERDGDLKSWIQQERFPVFLKLDSFTLYAMGESGKLVLLALVEEKYLCEESLRYKNLVETVAMEHREAYSRDFHLGYMEGTSYVSGLVMGEVAVPSLIVLNLSSDGFFLPPGPVDTEKQLLDFLDGVLDGSVEARGGNSLAQRFRRLLYEGQTTLKMLFGEAPALGCLVIGFPICMCSVFCYLCCKARNLDPDQDQDQDQDRDRDQDRDQDQDQDQDQAPLPPPHKIPPGKKSN
ncbi:protein disulfide-isomerase tmx3a-like [Menidia menidia]